MFRLLVLASLCWITVAGSTCPEGFKLFERNPTARNNHTKQWCLGVFKHGEDLGKREQARHMCISLNSSLSLPETLKEVDFVLESYNETAETGIAIDGEISRKCKIQFHKTQIGFANATGYCSLNNHLFEYDDSNSDPSFVQQHFNSFLPSRTYSFTDGDFPGSVADFSSCVVLLKNEIEKGGKLYYGDTSYCSGEKDGQEIHKVVCGRHPL